MKYNAYIDQLYEFHNAFNHPINVPDPNLSLLTLRADLIQEEAKEVNEAFDNVICGQYELPFDGTDKTVNKAALLKELCDLLYVVFGAAVVLGLPIQEAFNRVHASNMSKLGDDGKPIYREDGKVLKGPNYKAPDLSDLV